MTRLFATAAPMTAGYTNTTLEQELGPMKNGFGTRAVHSGRTLEGTGSIAPPLYTSVNYEQDEPGVPRTSYVYSRTGNPTRTALETSLAQIEDSRHAVTFSSGMAAIDAIVHSMCVPGDYIVIPEDIFSGTYRLLSQNLVPWGIQVSAIRMTDPASLTAVIDSRTKLVFAETPSNPMLEITDIGCIATITREAGVALVVDNTLASPYLQRPLEFGATATVYSNKFVSGHSDCMVGVASTNDDWLHERLLQLQNSAGSIPSPWDCWLTLRGIKTMHVRLDQQCANTEAIVRFLTNSNHVAQVFYPGLDDQVNLQAAKQQMSSYGSVVSFIPHGGEDAAKEICRSVELFTLAESVGAVDSLIQLPNVMTHQAANCAFRPVRSDVIRLSVGIEDQDDLIDDLANAIRKAARTYV